MATSYVQQSLSRAIAGTMVKSARAVELMAGLGVKDFTSYDHRYLGTLCTWTLARGGVFAFYMETLLYHNVHFEEPPIKIA